MSRMRMRTRQRAGLRITAFVLAALGVVGGWSAAQQLTPEDKALMTLNSARQAYNDRNYAFAAEKFRSFLREFAGHKQATAARYGLALTILEGPENDLNQAIELLQNVVAVKDSPDLPYALYHLGSALRSQGIQQAAPGTAEARKQAAPRFERAAGQFAAAAAAFSAIPTTRPATAGELPKSIEWANRARCDQAEMLLRLGRAKEAADLIGAWMKDPAFGKSNYRNQGFYLFGYASFTLKDYIVAGKSLSNLAPFKDPVIGVHARYLLARSHHLCDERPEAAAGYEAALAGYDAERKAAEAALKNPAALAPTEKTRLESLLNSPPPEHVSRSGFYLGALLYEQGRFPDALVRFQAFVQQNPKSPLLAEGLLRLGIAHVQCRQFGEGINCLNRLTDHPQFGDQALLWIAKAQASSGDPANPASVQQAIVNSLGTFKRAIDRAQQMSATDPAVKVRRFEEMLELGNAQQAVNQHKEAAATYQRMLNEGASGELAETATERLAVALQLAGQYHESEEACRQFLQKFTKSARLPEILFRYAEDAYLLAGTMHAQPEQSKQLYGEALKRYQGLLEKYPDSAFTNLARQGMGTAYYHLGQYPEAMKTLKLVPAPDRTGDLASVSYLIADCGLRTLPEAGDDALSVAKLIQAYTEASDMLAAFIAAQEGNPLPQAPDALIKLGYCLQRIAGLTADQTENRKAIGKARQAYVTFLQRYPQHPSLAVALFEDAKCLAELGDFATAASELSRFQTDPLRKSPLAPLALIRYGDYLRARKPAEAVTLLAQVRSQYETALSNDPARKQWVPMLHFAHAMALKDSGKSAEARAAFEAIAQRFAGTAEGAEAVWRSAQTKKDEALVKLETGRKALINAGSNKDAVQSARATIDQAYASLREAADYLAAQTQQFSEKPNLANLRLRMIYESAWINRMLGEAEIEAAREKLVLDGTRKQQQRMGVNDPQPPTASVLAVRAAEVPLTAIPLQPGEQKMRQQYQAIIASGSDAPLVNDARFELADHLARREEYDPAITMLKQCLEADPPPELLDRIRLRFGGCMLGKGDAKAAARQFNAILQNPRSPQAVHAKYGLGECAVLMQDWAAAIQHLLPFRDNDVFRSATMISDRAVLRLGHAYARLGQWEASRQSLEAVVQRFPYSPWVNEARYGVALAWQNLKNYDNAVNAYTEVINRTGSELAAKAQFQIGLCRVEQKRPKDALNAFLAVAYAYDYPELTASSLCEAAKAQVELQQKDEARKLLQRVIKDYPSGRWNEQAQKLLVSIK